MTETTIWKIAIIGGTGKEGRGLAYRWGKAGHQIIIGSRELARAEATANELNLMLANKVISGMENKDAAREGHIVVLTIPYSVHKETIDDLKKSLVGKLIIDVTVPLVTPKTKVQMPPAGSAAQEAVEILGAGVQVTAAFHNISYEKLQNFDKEYECDVLVTGTSKDSRQITLALVKDAGFLGWDAGPIENSVVLEGLTSILKGINRSYGSTTSGIKITGVKREI